MDEKLNIPLYIISLDKNLNVNSYKRYFNNVIVYPAIDVRKYNPSYFLENNTISFRVYNDLINGRKDHFGFPGIGGVGLYLTHRKLFQELVDNNVQSPIMIFEDDCIINNSDEFIKKVKLLHNKNYDCAIFGPQYKKNMKKNKNNIDIQFNESNNILDINKSINNELLNDFDKITHDISQFIFYHSSLWSQQGIKKMNELLKKQIEMQIDGYISMLGKENFLNVLLEKNKTTSQKIHKSSLKNDQICKICDMNANDKKYTLTFWDIVEKYVKLTIFLIIVITIIILYFKNRC